MNQSSESLECFNSKKKINQKLMKLKKKCKLLEFHDPSNLTTKNKISKSPTQKSNATPIRTQANLNKENLNKRELDISCPNAVLKPKKVHRAKSKKKIPSISSQVKCSRGYSSRDNMKNLKKNLHGEPSQSVLKSESSLKVLDTAAKLTPRSSHPSPQQSHRTPDNVRLSQQQNLPILTEKKSKISETGHYCKRISLFDKNILYSNSDHISNPSKDCPFEISKEALDDSAYSPEGLAGITKTLKLDALSPPQEASQLAFPFDFCVETPEVKLEASAPQVSVAAITEIAYNEGSYASPTRLINIYNSPEKILIVKTPEPIYKKQSESKAMKKNIVEFDSPGSFVFSLSSNSSEERFVKEHIEDRKTDKRQGLFFKKDEESQTDLTELVADSQVIEGLKLIGKLSEMVRSSN